MVEVAEVKSESLTESSAPSPENEGTKHQVPSPIGLALTSGRRVLWKGNPPLWLHFLLGPLRIYVFDPILAINSILLPAALPSSIDKILARAFEIIGIPLLKRMYAHNPKNTELASTARSTILHQPRAVSVQPPSDLQSAFIGAVSFACSALADIAGLLTNPKKFQGWMDAMNQFNTFLETTGVGGEMHEAIQKPLLRGRLLDNFKILNDVQEVHHADRVLVAQQEETSREAGQQGDIRRGHRLMRFATAAYGTEMIRSAVDKELDASDFLDDPLKAIALHAQIDEKDIKYVFSGNDQNYDEHILHHFVALNHEERSVVVAVRGTLSLSGAIVDIQGMAVDYCSGKAHKGISEMASNLWKACGDKVVKLMEEFPDYKLTVTGHSLGAGTACLLTVQLHVEEVFKGRLVECFAFAPPPTFWSCEDDSSNCCHAKIQQAMQNTVAYIHDNDVVPFLSVSAVRRMINLLDAVDNETEHIWFWRRWRIFYEYDPIPELLTNNVLETEKSTANNGLVDGERNMSIPARRVVWMKQNFAGRFEAFSCDPIKVAEGNVFLCPDMLTDHLPEQYENALDALLQA